MSELGNMIPKQEQRDLGLRSQVHNLACNFVNLQFCRLTTFEND